MIKEPIAILGFGVEGQAALEFLKREGFLDITLCDENVHHPLKDDLRFEEYSWILGKTAFMDLSSFKTVFRSPGVKYDLKSIVEAKDLGINVTSMTEMTLEEAKNRITGVTGSNGKTTTTRLTEAILRQKYGEALIVGGNDGVPVLQRAKDQPKDPILLEVSSFQFADLKNSPHIAAILNITPNHLDWHEDLADYIHAKSNVIQHQNKDDWAILNASNENTAKLVTKAPAQIFWLNKEQGDNWAVWKMGSLKVSINGKVETILDRTDFSLKTHPDNILCAVVIGLLHGLDKEMVLKGIQSFKGVPHRMEYLGEKKGVHIYNDSACTTPESTQVAIGQFEDKTLVMLLGGRPKETSFDYLVDDLIKHKVRVGLYGEQGPVIQKLMEEKGAGDLILFLDEDGHFGQMVEKAFHLCQSGDSLVLSPACTSFDMFKNAKERGKEFARTINQLLKF